MKMPLLSERPGFSRENTQCGAGGHANPIIKLANNRLSARLLLPLPLSSARLNRFPLSLSLPLFFQLPLQQQPLDFFSKSSRYVFRAAASFLLFLGAAVSLSFCYYFPGPFFGRLSAAIYALSVFSVFSRLWSHSISLDARVRCNAITVAVVAAAAAYSKAFVICLPPCEQRETECNQSASGRARPHKNSAFACGQSDAYYARTLCFALVFAPIFRRECESGMEGGLSFYIFQHLDL